jgi:hypothetical protein
MNCRAQTLLLLITAALLCSKASAGEKIELCPGPDERYRSPHYQVTVDDAGAAFVYYRENGWKKVPDKKGDNWECTAMSSDNNWVALSAPSSRGKIGLTIRPTGIAATKAELFPEKPGNTIAVGADGAVKVSIQLTDGQASYYFVRINGENGNKHPLFIFADPPESDIPARGPGVHFFEPGVHDIGPHYALKGGETVYIAAGAVVRGTITANGPGRVVVRGRGVLSGELLQEEWIRHKRGFVEKPKDARSWGIAPMIWNDDESGETIVEGITVIDAPSYNLTLRSRQMKVQNVKLLAWNYSTDGINFAGGLVENCFLKVNDDLFPLFRSGLIARNLVIWKQLNAAVFQFGYGYDTVVKDCLAERIDIVRDETNVQCGARAIISLEASKGCSFTGIRFQDIKVYGDTLNLLAIDNLDQDTPWSANIKDVKLREIDLALKRITITGTERGQWWTPFMDRKGQPMRSRLRTAGSGSIRVEFDDVKINGVPLRSEKDFPNGLEASGDVKLNFR